MDIEITTGLIAGGVTLLVCIINNHYQSSKFMALIEYRLNELEKRVDKHNNILERTYKLEETTSVHDERFEAINHRIEVLEGSETA